jgi:hypothetical protein
VESRVSEPRAPLPINAEREREREEGRVEGQRTTFLSEAPKMKENPRKKVPIGMRYLETQFCVRNRQQHVVACAHNYIGTRKERDERVLCDAQLEDQHDDEDHDDAEEDVDDVGQHFARVLAIEQCLVQRLPVRL